MKKIFLLIITVLSLCVSVHAIDGVQKAAQTLKLNITEETVITDTGSGYYFTVPHNDGECNVFCAYDGVVLSYAKNVQKVKTSLPLLTKNDAKRFAQSFVINVASDILGTIDLSRAEVTYSGTFNVVYYRVHNGIVYSNNYVSLSVDGDTGEILSYYREYDKDAVFSHFENILSPEKIFDMFKREGRLNLTYNKSVSGGDVFVYPVYTLDHTLLYNGVTGSAVNREREIIPDNYFDIASMYEKIKDSSNESEEMLRPIEAQLLARSIPELNITDDYRIVSARYLKNSNQKYLIILNYESEFGNVSVTVDAKSGLVCEFTRTGVAPSYNNQTANEVIKDYISKHLGEYIYNLKLSSVYNGEKTVYLYERMVDDIPFPANGLCIAVDKSGNISNISFLWENLDFSKDGIISLHKAYQIFENKCKFELKYHFDGEKNIPVYSLSSNTTGIIDARTGEVLGYDGKILHSAKYLNYTDLDTFYGKDIVEKMADCDIYASRGNVALYDEMLQKDYLLLISSYLPGGKPVIENFADLNDQQMEMLYNAFTSTGILDVSEIDYDAPVSREKAVEYFIKTIGYGDVAENYHIFDAHFKDVRSMEKGLIGYIELARSLKIVNGSDGYFRPKQNLKNGDALIMVYNYLTWRTNNEPN
ncbi:MAG: hypothetical protein IJA19_06385 [Clostridia bacterium]|nr:hypothetical protein [Clostridia bacterium]